MLSPGMLCPRADKMSLRKRTFPSGSPPPIFAAMVISRASLLKRAPRMASNAPLKRLTFDHLLCPAMGMEFSLEQCCSTHLFPRNQEAERLEKEWLSRRQSPNQIQPLSPVFVKKH